MAAYRTCYVQLKFVEFDAEGSACFDQIGDLGPAGYRGPTQRDKIFQWPPVPQLHHNSSPNWQKIRFTSEFDLIQPEFIISQN